MERCLQHPHFAPHINLCIDLQYIANMEFGITPQTLALGPAYSSPPIFRFPKYNDGRGQVACWTNAQKPPNGVPRLRRALNHPHESSYRSVGPPLKSPSSIYGVSRTPICTPGSSMLRKFSGARTWSKDVRSARRRPIREASRLRAR